MESAAHSVARVAHTVASVAHSVASVAQGAHHRTHWHSTLIVIIKILWCRNKYFKSRTSARQT